MQDVTIRDVYELVERVEVKMEKTYVTKAEFLPVKNIVYGLVSLILMAVTTAVVATVVKASI